MGEDGKGRRAAKPKYLRLAAWISERLSYRSDRVMPWAMIHTSYLDHPDFEQLPDAAKFHLLGLMLYVQRSGFNHLPADPVQLARKIGANSCVDLELLVRKHFLEPVKLRQSKKMLDARYRSTEDRSDIEDRSKVRSDRTPGRPRSVFTESQILRYAEAMHDSGRGIKQPGRFAKARYQDGKADEEIRIWLMTRQPVADCAHCQGGGEKYVEGRGVVPCECVN